MIDSIGQREATDQPASVNGIARVVLRNSMFGFGAQMLLKLLSFGFSVLIVRHLGVETYGQYAAILAFGAVFVFLADLGLSPYLVREVAYLRSDHEGAAASAQLYGNVLALRLTLSAFTAIVVVVAGWVTNRPAPMLVGIALGTIGLIMYGAQGTAEAMLAGGERLDLSAAPRVLNQVAFVTIGALALWIGTGYLGLIAANLAGVGLMTWTSLRAITRLGYRPRRPRVSTWLPLLRRALPFGVIAFTLGLSYKVDGVLLNIFRGDFETGYYAAAYNLVFSIVVLSNVINTALYPSLSRTAATAPTALDRICASALRYLMSIALPITAGTWLLAEPLVQALFTASYTPAVLALQIVIWTTPLMFASEFLGYVVVIQGRERHVARAIVISTTLNVALNLVLIPRLGFVGAAVMTVLTEAVLVGQYIWTLRRLLRPLDWSRILVRPTVATVVMSGVVFTARELPLPLSAGLGVATYGLMLVALRVFGSDELRFLRTVVRPRFATS